MPATFSRVSVSDPAGRESAVRTGWPRSEGEFTRADRPQAGRPKHW